MFRNPFGFWYLGGGVPRPRSNRAGRGQASEPLLSSTGEIVVKLGSCSSLLKSLNSSLHSETKGAELML